MWLLAPPWPLNCQMSAGSEKTAAITTDVSIFPNHRSMADRLLWNEVRLIVGHQPHGESSEHDELAGVSLESTTFWSDRPQ